ncbi:hypothetical protein LCGC14_1332840 [marine sediment metagenome]|uniref:Uncharacterized protein n=1 Tax=marine sediment metagenome TaxID=412755 RepID=A0A0F9KGR2_9ZZZZ
MPQKDGKESIISESGNWNVADQYTKSKIMRPLNLCDYYEDIAMFGYETIADELINYSSPPNDVIKYKALLRLLHELIRLIDNCKFALKVGKTKEQVLKYREQLIELSGLCPKLIKSNIDQSGAMVFKITNLARFDKLLSIACKIKSKINEPLNKNHLIFTDREEFDPKAWKKSLKERMISQG